MLTEDDLPTPKPHLVPNPPLDRLGVAELQAYIAGLQAEIERARAEIAKKDAVRNAADAFFRMP